MSMQRHPFPGEFEGDEVLGQLAERWQDWQRQSPKAPFIVIGIVGLIALLIWLATGFYMVGPGEQGVVRRFGKEVARTGPGLRYRLPYPIERVEVVNLAVVRRVEVGFRSDPRYRVIPQEALMLTGDENIVDAQAIVQYRVKDPGQYLFRVRDPDQSLRDSTEVALRSVIGRTTIDEAMTVGRVRIQDSARDFLQQLLDAYHSGLMVTELKLQVVDPPEQVKDAFHEVVRAREDRERLINEALGYQEDVIPKARGQGEQIVRTAEAYKAQRVIRAEGDAAKFVTILKEYERAQEITEQRLYLETLQRVLPKAQKIVISPQLEGGILPFLPLRDQAPRVLAPPGPDGKRGAAETAPSAQTVPQPGRAVR
jgi:membrane protease subunit HflK